MTGKMVTQVEPYGLLPAFEAAVATLTCSSPSFYARIGQHLEIEALQIDAAKLAVRTAKSISPALSLMFVQQRLREQMSAGKVDLAEVEAVQLLFDGADTTVDIEHAIEAMADILKRRAHSVGVMMGHDEYGRKGDFSSVIAQHEKAERIGRADAVTAEEPMVRCAADIEPESVEWLWRDRIPRGKITMFDGEPGLGKSTVVSADLAARVSTGAAMPGEEETFDGVPGNVLLLSGEDDAASTIVPRLLAHGADMPRVQVIRPDAVTLAEPDKIEQLIVEHAAVLLGIDPVMGFFGKVDSHKDQEIRRLLMPLASVAERTNCAIVCVRHLNKISGASAIHRGGGSIGISGAARSVLLVAKNPDCEDQRILASVKSNLGPPPTALVYTIVSDTIHGCGRVVWCGESTLTADALVAPPKVEKEDDTSALGEACRVLHELLADGVPRPSKEVIAEALAAGVATKTLRRAKDRLQVRATKSGVGGWSWSLPKQDGQDGQDAQDVQAPEAGHLPPDQDAQPQPDVDLGQDGHLGQVADDQDVQGPASGHLGHLGHLPEDDAPRRVAYADLTEFQRQLHDEHGELFGIEVFDCPASVLTTKDAAQ